MQREKHRDLCNRATHLHISCCHNSKRKIDEEERRSALRNNRRRPCSSVDWLCHSQKRRTASRQAWFHAVRLKKKRKDEIKVHDSHENEETCAGMGREATNLRRNLLPTSSTSLISRASPRLAQFFRRKFYTATEGGSYQRAGGNGVETPLSPGGRRGTKGKEGARQRGIY